MGFGCGGSFFMSVVREIWGGGGLKERAEGWVGFTGEGRGLDGVSGSWRVEVPSY